MAEELTKLTDLCIIVAVLWFAAIIILCTFELYSLYYFEIEAKDILNVKNNTAGTVGFQACGDEGLPLSAKQEAQPIGSAVGG